MSWSHGHELTDEQREIRELARRFADEEIAPHAAAWDREHRFPKEVFGQLGELGLMGVCVPVEHGGAGADYLSYVDGRTRADGVRSFLSSRGISLPEGGPTDDSAAETVNGLGNRKNDAFLHTLHTEGVKVFEGSRRYVEAVVEQGLAIAVVSSSANTKEVLEVTGLDRYVDERVDGVTMLEEGIAGKPAPDSYLAGARRLGVEPAVAAVFEDALSGVEAGHAGHFGIVVGVDRVGQAEALKAHGADVVVTDLADLLADQ